MDASAILDHFPIKGTVKSVKPLGNGLINDSYKVETEEPDCPDYVLQRINHEIFKDVDVLQKNILAATGHIRKKLEESQEKDIDRKVLQFLISDSGKSYHIHDGKYWRVMIFIPDAISYDNSITPALSFSAGKAFGNFQYMLSDIETTLAETIPDFHNMEFRMQQLREAVAEDKVGKLESVRDLVDKMEARADEMCKAERWFREGKLPKRICHCDTKVNNVMFDHAGEVLCVVDLDTVMPSFIFSDYGDFLRFSANPAPEDEKDLTKIDFNMEIFKSFTKGYLESASKFLTPLEIENLSFAAKLFPYMQAVRFLWDYLRGSVYWKTQYEDHQLVRAKAQWKLFESVEAKEEEMKAFISECLKQ